MKLSTSAFQEMRKAEATGTPTGRAEVLRRAMLTLIDTGSAREPHPANWAPFVVVGEAQTTDAIKAERYVSWGYAALRFDSFAARGIKNECNNADDRSGARCARRIGFPRAPLRH